MTAAAILIAASAAITLVLGTLHLVFTFSGERFFPLCRAHTPGEQDHAHRPIGLRMAKPFK